MYPSIPREPSRPTRARSTFSNATVASTRELRQHRVELLGRHRLPVLVVDLHRGRPVAAGDALDLLDREEPVGARLVSGHAELPAAMLEHILAAVQVAGDRRAELEMELSNRLQVVH